MGKSNNLYDKFGTVYQRENNLEHFLKENEIQKLENINNDFSYQFIIDFSHFIKKSVRLISYSMKIESYSNINNIKCCNLIKMLPGKNKSVIIFSSNFLSVTIDFLFGGNGNFKNQINILEDITSTEFFINEKIIKLIMNIFSDLYKKNISSEIKFFDPKIVMDLKQCHFNSTELFLINYFNFYIDNIKVFFSVFIPISIFIKIEQKIVSSIINNKKKHTEKKISNLTTLSNIYDVELNITTKLMSFSVSYDKFCTLSIGDILSIKKPDKIIGCIENKPVFFGNYKRFNEQSIVFIEEFINNNLMFAEEKEYSNE